MRSRRVILSGDHHQLPPMIVSEKALEMKFDVSLMEQVAKQSPECVSMLTTQYR